MTDEKLLTQGEHRIIGYLGPRASSYTLAWLATHRDRLRMVIVGFKHLTVLVSWDTKGGELVDHSDAEVEALRTIVNGERS